MEILEAGKNLIQISQTRNKYEPIFRLGDFMQGPRLPPEKDGKAPFLIAPVSGDDYEGIMIVNIEDFIQLLEDDDVKAMSPELYDIMHKEMIEQNLTDSLYKYFPPRLSIIFGRDAFENSNSIIEMAIKSKVEYVRSKDHLARWSEKATGEVLTSLEVLYIYGLAAMEDVLDRGSAIIQGLPKFEKYDVDASAIMKQKKFYRK